MSSGNFRKKFDEEIHIKIFRIWAKNSRYWAKKCQQNCQNCNLRVQRNIWGKNEKNQKTFKSLRESFWISAKKFRYGCHNCILLVHRNNLRKKDSRRKFVDFIRLGAKKFQCLSKDFLAGLRKCIVPVRKTVSILFNFLELNFWEKKLVHLRCFCEDMLEKRLRIWRKLNKTFNFRRISKTKSFKEIGQKWYSMSQIISYLTTVETLVSFCASSQYCRFAVQTSSAH